MSFAPSVPRTNSAGPLLPGQTPPAPSPAPVAQTAASSSSAPKPPLTLEQQHITAVEGIVPTLQYVHVSFGRLQVVRETAAQTANHRSLEPRITIRDMVLTFLDLFP